MRNFTKLFYIFSLIIATSLFMACSDDIENEDINPELDLNPNNLPEEYFSGGLLGTTFNETTSCFEQATPAVELAGLGDAFLHGEAFFDDEFIGEGNPEHYPMRGTGPVSVRTSCKHCHPGYGHGKRLGNLGQDVKGFDTQTESTGNGYLLVVYGAGKDGVFGDDNGINGADDSYVSQVTGMPQTQAKHPFVAPIDESKIEIKWHKHIDKDGNKYADGSSYELIYPEVIIPNDAFYVEMPSEYAVRLEATIGIYGTGLLDAIEESDILAVASKQIGKPYAGRAGKPIKQPDGTTRIGRFTYGLSRGTLQNGAGSNAFWNITNVTRESSNSLYRTNYMTHTYAEAASKDQNVIAALGDTYYNFLKGNNEEETQSLVYNYLRFNSLTGMQNEGADLNDPSKQKKAEVTLEGYTEFMVWHRGLAVPAARKLDDPTVMQGKELFYSTQMGCTSCHKPSWTTGEDNYVGDADMVGKLPRYPHQKIWPYSDMLQHNLGLKNNIRTAWCRTTPLWGRSLNKKANGESSHLHDMRARTYEEAIMWHGGQAQYSRDAFRVLSKADRDAMVKFLQSI